MESDARSVISTQTFRRALTACGGQLRGDKECPFSDVTKSGRVWRKVPESDARSVPMWLPNTKKKKKISEKLKMGVSG